MVQEIFRRSPGKPKLSDLQTFLQRLDPFVGVLALLELLPSLFFPPFQCSFCSLISLPTVALRQLQHQVPKHFHGTEGVWWACCSGCVHECMYFKLLVIRVEPSVATSFPKYQKFSSQLTIFGTSCKQPQPLLKLKVWNFLAFFTSRKRPDNRINWIKRWNIIAFRGSKRGGDWLNDWQSVSQSISQSGS